MNYINSRTKNKFQNPNKGQAKLFSYDKKLKLKTL